MGCLIFISLLAFLSSGIESASLPYHDGFEWHFNQMGVHLDLVFKDQTNPLVGGKAHVEMPISAVWKLMEGENQMLKPLVIALEKSTLGRMYDIMTVKADITFNAEMILEGIFNLAVDYTLVHKDGTEEKVTLLVQGKTESGKLVTSLEVIPSTMETIPNQIMFPVKMIFTCNWPNAHTITIKGTFGKILINIANDINEVSVTGVLKYLGTQYKYSTVLSIKEKFFTVTYTDPTEEPKNVVLKFKVLNGYPTIEITGNVPTCRLFKAGVFKTVLIQNNLYDFTIKHTYNGMEVLNFNVGLTNGMIDMTVKYGQMHKTHMVIAYEYMKYIKVVFPLTNTWLSGAKDLGIELNYQPTNEAKLLEGGNIKIVAMRDTMPIMKIGGYYGLTIDATKYEILLNDIYVNILNESIKGMNFSEVKFYGKIFFDRLNKNGLMHKLSFETKFVKDGSELFNVLLTTVETPYKLHVFCPYLLKSILNIQSAEYLEITHGHVVVGKETTITTICNLTSKKLVAKITPTMISYELLDGEVSLVKYLNELSKMEIETNSVLLKGKTIVHLNPSHLCYLPATLCFNDLTTVYHVEVVNKVAGKVIVKTQLIKDTVEILNVEINNVEVPCKISFKVPVMPFEFNIEYELSTKEWKVLINNKNKKSLLMVKPTIGTEFELDINGVPLFKIALSNKEVKITSIMKDIPAITATVTWKAFSLFENTLGIELLYGKIAHKTVLGWNINLLKKAFVDIKLIGSGTQIFADYELTRHLNWNIISLKNIDLAWNGKVLSTGLKMFNTPMLTEGNLLIKRFVIDMKLVETIMGTPYTLILTTKPLKIALLPIFQYP